MRNCTTRHLDLWCLPIQCHHISSVPPPAEVLVLPAALCSSSQSRTRLPSHNSHRRTYPRSHQQFCVEPSRESNVTMKSSFFRALQMPLPLPGLLFNFIPDSAASPQPLPCAQHISQKASSLLKTFLGRYVFFPKAKQILLVSCSAPALNQRNNLLFCYSHIICKSPWCPNSQLSWVTRLIHQVVWVALKFRAAKADVFV